MKYLVTGATGNIGSRITIKLIAKGIRPRVFVRDEAKARARFGEAVEITVGDFGDRVALARALEGIDAMMLITSGNDLAVHDRTATEQARSANVGRIVKLSSYDAADRIGTGAWHADGEAVIRQSGIAHAFVRPSGFMDNALYWAPSIKAEGVVRSPTASGAVAFIHPDDIAEVAIAALSDDRSDECLPITGPQALTFGQMTAMIGHALGRELHFKDSSDESVRQQMAAMNAPQCMIDARLSTMRAIREGLYNTVSDVLHNVLGRPPIAFNAWVLQQRNAFI